MPITLGIPGQKGGRTNYARLTNDVVRQLKQDRRAYCTTMLDYYGLGSGFPGTPVPEHLDSVQKVERIEGAVKADICERVPDVRPDLRFLPYLSLHEYESLLFSDPNLFAQSIGKAGLGPSFQRIRDHFPTPEDINDAPETAPSKRVVDIYGGYKKVIEGTLAARAIGIDKMRSECRHFRAWVGRLETLSDLDVKN
jgi:hypothetical protein